MSRRYRWALAGALVTLVFATSTWAGGLWLYEINAPSTGTASAGWAAFANDASTAFTNPAGMTQLEGSQLLLGAQPLVITTEFDVDIGTAGGGDGGNAGRALPSLSSFFVHSISEDLKVGASLLSYFGAGLKYDDDWAGRYYVQKAIFLTLGVTPTIAYRCADWLSIGGGFSVLYGALEQEAAINNVLDGLPDGQLQFKDGDFAFGGNLGMLIEPKNGTRFGVTYYSQAKFEFEDQIGLANLGPGLSALLGARGLLGSVVEMDFTFPQQIMISGYHQLTDNLALVGNLGWQDWSEFGKVDVAITATTTQSTTVNLNTKDTWHWAFGAQYRIAGAWLVSAGFAYDTSPMEKEDRSPAMPLDRQFRFAGGVQYDLKDDLTLGLAYTYADLGSADLDVNKGNLAGRLKGDYSTNRLQVVNVNLNWRF
jgi:long-chain fatty acid transport protein